MSSSSNLSFSVVTIFSVVLVISSSNWISVWMGLEMNLMAFIPLISKTKNHFLSQSCMMYFMMQSMGSLMLLFIVLLNSLMLTKSTIDNEYMNLTVMMSMWIKMGVPPFHFWFPEMMSKLNWLKCFLLMTLQKTAPMTILSAVNNNYMLTLMITMSVLIGAIGGINQTSTRKLMAYSSINHMGWMMSCIIINNNMWIIYLIMYSLMLIPITMWLSKNKIYNLNQVYVSVNTNVEKVMVAIMMLSLGGLPPFIGFFPKWMVIQYMMEIHMKWTITIMLMCSLLTLFFYMRMISSYYLMSTSMSKWMIKPMKTSMESTLMFTLNLALPMIMYMSML